MDIDAIVSQVDIDAIAKRIDVDAIVERIDVDAIVSRVDIDAVVRRLDLVALAEEVVNGIDCLRSSASRPARWHPTSFATHGCKASTPTLRSPESSTASSVDAAPDTPTHRVSLSQRYRLGRSAAQRAAAMSAHVDPIPREARPFQGHRAGLMTRIAAAAIDFGIVIIALAVCYLGVSAFLFLLNPRSLAPRQCLLRCCIRLAACCSRYISR